MVVGVRRDGTIVGDVDASSLIDELQDYEDNVRRRLQEGLERQAADELAQGRFPFAGGWYEIDDIRRFQRRAWLRWVVARLEALAVIAFIALGAALVFGTLTLWLPQ